MFLLIVVAQILYVPVCNRLTSPLARIFIKLKLEQMFLTRKISIFLENFLKRQRAKIIFRVESIMQTYPTIPSLL